MPTLCDTTDFGLDNEVYNKKCGLEWLARKPQVIEEIFGATLYRVGSHEQGFFFLWDPVSNLVGYYIKYSVKRTKLHGMSVTQTALWRNLLVPSSENITRHVFYDILLKEYPAIMSDQIQTDDGKRFWLDQLTKSLTRGYSVCLVDFNTRELQPIDTHADLRNLISTKSPWAWASMKHRALRFMIYRKDAV